MPNHLPTVAEKNRAARRRRGDEQILSALAAGKSYREAAREAGLSYKTVQRRVADPLFRAELDDLKRNVVRQAAAHIANAATSAVAALEALLADRDPWVRLRAAAKILDTAIDYNQEALITDRIAALEERANELRAAR